MATFVKRTTAPDTSNACYYANNPFYQSGYGMPNCTAYAWGRFYELSGEYPSLSLGDAENWYNYSDGYARGKTPKLGAVAVWAMGAIGDDSDGSGHVAIVEQINDDGSIVTSNSAWNSTLFYMQDIGNDYSLSGYTFLGFIYNPVNFGSSTIDIPEPISGNRFLSMSEMQNNAIYIYWYLSSRGWTLNAIAGLLGNMQTESTINPGIWENLDDTQPDTLGRGLVGWTPANRVNAWAEERGLDPAAMDTQLEMLRWEVVNGGVYYTTTAYPTPTTFEEFTKSTESPYYLGMAFLYNYERPYVQDQPARGEQAEYWYSYLSGIEINPDPGSGKTKKKKGFKFVLFGRRVYI